MDVIGSFKLLSIIITFKQDILGSLPCSFFFLSRFNQSAHLPCVPSHMETTTGGSKLSLSNIFFGLHNLVRLSGSLLSPACPPRCLTCPLQKPPPWPLLLSCLPAISDKIGAWPSILLQSHYCLWPLQGHSSPASSRLLSRTQHCQSGSWHRYVDLHGFFITTNL
jgi:hypothetical protein